MRPDPADLIPHFVLTSDLRLPGDRSAFYRAASLGRYVRIRPGVFLDAGRWGALDPEARHLARAHAAALIHPSAVFSHLTAALLWDLPLIDPPPPLPHTLVGRADGGRSTNSVIRFAVGEPEEVVEIDGLRVTGLRETVIATASTFDPLVAVPIVDAALAGRTRGGVAVARDDLLDTVVVKGQRRAEFSCTFGDARSGSPGESVSRVTMHRAGIPAPELQVRFDDGAGLAGIVDFWWPEARLIGEFDGLGKYRRDLAGRGRDPAQIVIDEKIREDRLRSLGPRMTRWGWRTARSAIELRAVLTRAGLRTDRMRSRR